MDIHTEKVLCMASVTEPSNWKSELLGFDDDDDVDHNDVNDDDDDDDDDDDYDDDCIRCFLLLFCFLSF